MNALIVVVAEVGPLKGSATARGVEAEIETGTVVEARVGVGVAAEAENGNAGRTGREDEAGRGRGQQRDERTGRRVETGTLKREG